MPIPFNARYDHAQQGNSHVGVGVFLAVSHDSHSNKVTGAQALPNFCVSFYLYLPLQHRTITFGLDLR